jgi:hypothetical protein
VNDFNHVEWGPHVTIVAHVPGFLGGYRRPNRTQYAIASPSLRVDFDQTGEALWLTVRKSPLIVPGFGAGTVEVWSGEPRIQLKIGAN